MSCRVQAALEQAGAIKLGTNGIRDIFDFTTKRRDGYYSVISEGRLISPNTKFAGHHIGQICRHACTICETASTLEGRPLPAPSRCPSLGRRCTQCVSLRKPCPWTVARAARLAVSKWRDCRSGTIGQIGDTVGQLTPLRRIDHVSGGSNGVVLW